MSTHTIDIATLQDYPKAAKEFLALMGDSTIFAFYGNMGVKDTVNSPTFAIVNEYADEDGNPIYHFDMYRIKSVAELYNMGYEDYFYSGAICLIEWPELAEDVLPEESVRVSIEETENGTRTISIEQNR